MTATKKIALGEDDKAAELYIPYLGVTIYAYRSRLDGRVVVEIDTSDNDPASSILTLDHNEVPLMKVMLNEAVISDDGARKDPSDEFIGVTNEDTSRIQRKKAPGPGAHATSLLVHKVRSERWMWTVLDQYLHEFDSCTQTFDNKDDALKNARRDWPNLPITSRDVIVVRRDSDAPGLWTWVETDSENGIAHDGAPTSFKTKEQAIEDATKTFGRPPDRVEDE